MWWLIHRIGVYFLTISTRRLVRQRSRRRVHSEAYRKGGIVP